MSKRRETDFLALLAAVLCIAVGYLSRDALNPDGVSYLDLAGAVQRGDWLHFVQGYWSPLYPLITGAIGLAVNRGGAGLVPITHLMNTIAALGAILVLWRWTRLRAAGSLDGSQPAAPGPIGRAFIAAFLICSAGLPRIEAVTPDVFLLFLMIWLSYELLIHGGRRWLLVGALLGAAFLTKTSSWPWLVAAIPVRFLAAGDSAMRRRVFRSSVVCAALMLTWVVPLSMKYGHPTLGSSGALNWSWYMEGRSTRLPDTDQGGNSSYHDVGVGNGRLLSIATFDDAAYWTYQPWGDPTAWSAMETGDPGRSATLDEMVVYWLRMFGRVFGLWCGPLIVGTLLPWVVLRFRPGMVRELWTTQRDALAVISLGLAGLFQFVAVHAEPRLLAPFAAMLALGAIHWCFARPDTPRFASSSALRGTLGWIGIAAALGFAVPRMIDGVQSATRLRDVTTQLNDLRRRLAMVNDGPVPIAVVGPAAPIMASAFWVNARISMQVAPRFASLVATLPPDEQKQMLLTLFRGKVPMIWKTSADGSMEMLLVPPK